MKFIYCLLISSLLGINFCQAQIPFKIKAGIARSNLRGFYENGFDPHATATWYGGVATTFRMGKRFFFQPELLYSKRGTNLKSEYSTENRKTLLRYGYISMPLLLGWHPIKKMSLLLGAEPGYLLDEPGTRISVNNYEDVNRRFNVDVDLGISYQPLKRWTVEVRAMAGLIGMYEELQFLRISRTIYRTGTYQGYHSTIQLGISYDIIHQKDK
jgi:hypothetical protein